MSERFLAEMFTPAVQAAQARSHGRAHPVPTAGPSDRLGPDELAFIARRDSCYVATVNSDGWPYIQHRGGPPGFLRVVDGRTLGFADLRGNRQLITTGNLAGNDRVALFLIDYPQRARLKILGHARVRDARDDAALADALAPTPALRRRVERVVLVDVVAFDWNCSAYITPRYTADEVEELIATRGLR